MTDSIDKPFYPEDSKLTPLNLDHTKKHSNILESISTFSIYFDFFAKIILFFGFLIYVVCQIMSIHTFMNKEIMMPAGQRLDSNIITTYIKYSLGYNSALVLILGYWFGSNGGFSKVVHRIIIGIIDRRSKM